MTLVVPDQVQPFKWTARARVDKYGVDKIDYVQKKLEILHEPCSFELAQLVVPDDVEFAEGNLLVRQGRKRIIDRLVGTASNQALDNTHVRIGVGDSTTAFDATHTDLQASSNKQFELIDTGTTIVGSGASSGVVTFVATFETGDANFAWQEWGIDGGTADSSTVTTDGNTTPGLINRKVVSLGTKTSAAAWVFTVTITIT